MSENKDLDYYMNLDWTLIEGTDLDFNGNPYHYIEIKEIPSFAFCAKTREKALENYKKHVRDRIFKNCFKGVQMVIFNYFKKYKIKKMSLKNMS